MNTNRKPKFSFISSYRGEHDYKAMFADGSERRVSVRTALDQYPEHCTMTRYSFEMWVNGRLGLLTGSTELLTAEFVAEFNRHCYQEWRSQVDTIIASPERYGQWDGRLFNVNVGAHFCRSIERWIPLQSFEKIRDMAGIPAEWCSDPRPDLRVPSMSTAAA